jgi:UrcA family protein
MTMNTRTNNRLLIGAAVLACAVLSGTAAAKEPTVTVALRVSSAGLDLSQPADAHTFYMRLENAAWVACTRGDRVDLVPTDDLKGCYEKALGSAVRSTGVALVTQVYLSTHTYSQAAAHGIAIPSQVAGR